MEESISIRRVIESISRMLALKQIAGSALFAKIKQSSEINRNFDWQPLKIQNFNSILNVLICIGNP